MVEAAEDDSDGGIGGEVVVVGGGYGAEFAGVGAA